MEGVLYYVQPIDAVKAPISKAHLFFSLPQTKQVTLVDMEFQLATGLYTIRTAPSLQIIGRNIVEEDSYAPKGINGQPLGVPVTENTTFLLRHSGLEDVFYITCGRDRGRVVEMEGKVVAALHDIEEEVVEMDVFDYYTGNRNLRWVIRRQPQHGDDIYTYVSLRVCLVCNVNNLFTYRIESEDGYWGWVMLTEHPQYTPVMVRRLVATATMPPMYTPNELWVIERVG